MGLTHFAEFASRLREFMRAHSRNSGAHEQSEQVFNHLALRLFELQFTYCAPYRSFCAARGVAPGKIRSWAEIPAVPAAAFKELELTSLGLPERSTVFHSSGTSGHRPSRHFHNTNSLSIYEESLLPWFQIHFFPDSESCLTLFSRCARSEEGRWNLAILTPPRAQTPHSSLVYMFDTIWSAFGAEESGFLGSIGGDNGWTVEVEAALAMLQRATRTHKPLAMLGTAFSFVHLLDFMIARNLIVKLPSGSRVLETGGYKGRSRLLPRTELHSLITERLGVPLTHILSEYGMSELGSQAYAGTIGSAGPAPGGLERGSAAESPVPASFRFPPWARSRVISAETGREVADGQTGLIQVLDLANVYSVMAIQTEDLAVRRGHGFELIGRALDAEPRGCSLMANATV